ncbi:protein FAM183A isoform X1 [Hoplias malabaricus]|uniref:protein FAM183A isoform X1 n=1 Tax=Hoplias malabaricus TaxID=27720 RepID=UPI003462FC0F
MAAAGKAKEKEPVDVVHQTAIHVETIMKERRSQKLYTTFSINPFKKLHVLADNPMARTTQEQAEEDPTFLNIIHGARIEPTKKYTHPMTESQEIGWISTPLTRCYSSKRGKCISITFISEESLYEQIVSDRSDRRLNFPRQNSEITKYMDAAWRLKEQTQNLG